MAQAEENPDIKRVPPSESLREQIRAEAAIIAGRLEPSATPKKGDLDLIARQLLRALKLPDDFVGWTMVMLASEFWKPKIVAVPYERRLLLLTANSVHGAHCSAGDNARTKGEVNGRSQPASMADCPACSTESLGARAKELGYRVLSTDESVAILAALSGAETDAAMGVASLDLLEKAIDQIPQFDIPCMAVPLLEAAATAAGASLPFDADWIRRMIELPYVPADRSTPNYRPLQRAARRMFEPDELERLAPRLRKSPRVVELNGDAAALLDPLAGTEAIAYDFLTRGGKHSRPFITLAVYDAMTGGEATRSDGHRRVAELPLSVRRAAVSIETFHKASLVHDDIEDDDQFRYGTPTLHRAFGLSTAINVGDYLIGLGYRLVSRESGALGPDTVADVMDRLADAHMKLTEGQGAELLWRDSRRKHLLADEAIEIYALKTAPAFEAALITGLRLARPCGEYRKPIGEFARHLGIAFQILNDLADWAGDDNNKLVAAGDIVGGRPTVLWALALEGLTAANCSRLETLADSTPISEAAVCEIRELYQSAGVFDKADRLVGEYTKRARGVAESIEPPELRRLLHYLIDVALKPRC